MIDTKALIEKLHDPSVEIRIQAADALAQLESTGVLGGLADRVGLALLDHFRTTTDPREFRAMQAAFINICPVGYAVACTIRPQWQEREAARVNARGLTAEQARKRIADLVWSFGEATPHADDLTDQGVALVAIGLEGPAVIPDLVSLMVNNAQLRGQIVGVLGNIGREREQVGESLVDLLTHSDTAVVDAAVSALGRAGSAGGKTKEAVAALVRLFAAFPDSYSSTAVSALVGLKSDQARPIIVDTILRTVHEDSRENPEPWLDLLAFMTDSSPEAVTALTNLLRHTDPKLRAAAAWASGHMPGGVGDMALPLCHALNDPDKRVRRGAAYVLHKSGGSRMHQIVPFLVAALGDPDRNVCMEAMRALAENGSAAAAALPELQKILEIARAEQAGVRKNYKAAKDALKDLEFQMSLWKTDIEEIERAIRRITTAAG